MNPIWKAKKAAALARVRAADQRIARLRRVVAQIENEITAVDRYKAKDLTFAARCDREAAKDQRWERQLARLVATGNRARRIRLQSTPIVSVNGGGKGRR